MKRFGTVIKEARLSKGWSLKVAAARLGTFKGYICGIEGGNLNPPSPKMIRKMAAVYGLDADDLLSRSAIAKLPKGLRLETLHALLGDVIAKRTA